MLGQSYSFGADARRLMEPAPTAALRTVRLDTSVELMLERSKRHIGERVLATIVATAGSTYRKAGARMLLTADGTYLGLLGPTARRNRVVHALGAEAAGIETRLRGPVGLNIGAVTPESIALAIVSEIHAWLAGRDARCSRQEMRTSSE